MSEEESEVVQSIPLTPELVGEKLFDLQAVRGKLDYAFVRVDLREMQLGNIAGLKDFKYLQHINASKNAITSLSGISSVDVMSLDLTENALASLDTLPSLPKLQLLEAGQNKLTSCKLPSLPQLTKLIVAQNKITSLDGVAASIPRLVTLDISQNALTALVGLESLKSLSVVLASENEIALVGTLPASVTELRLAKNKLTSFESVGANALPAIKVLDLSENQVEDLKQVKTLSKYGKTLRELKLAGNPLASVDTYKSDVLLAIPLLKKLDDEEITDDDRQAAKELAAARIEEEKRKAEEEAAAASAAAEAAAAEAAAAAAATAQE